MNGAAQAIPNFGIRSVAATCRNEGKRSCQRDNKQPKYQRRSRTFLLSAGSNCRSPQEINASTDPSPVPFFPARTNFVVTDGISKNVRYLSRWWERAEVCRLIMPRSVDGLFGGETARCGETFKRASARRRRERERENLKRRKRKRGRRKDPAEIDI